MKHNSGSFAPSDILFLFLIILLIGVLTLAAVVRIDASIKKKEFYSANGYVEVKYKGMDIWIKKTDIDLINTVPIEK